MSNFDTIARRYVEHDMGAAETFGPIPKPANDNRRGDFMQTFTGRKFWPLDPRPGEIDILDIAHALAMQCRYGGHSRNFYSVAEHCVHVSRWLSEMGESKKTALVGLLHDATEAYLVDLPRPVKASFPDYKSAEDRLWRVIARRYGLPEAMPAKVHEADNRILADEIRQNMVPMDWHDKHDDPLGIRLQFWSPDRAETEFLLEFVRLTDGKGRV